MVLVSFFSWAVVLFSSSRLTILLNVLRHSLASLLDGIGIVALTTEYIMREY
jgi:hypothetical protein